jgi:predicted PurR-regulated permease PerM
VQDGTLQRAVNESLDRYPQLAYMLRHSSEILTLSQAAERAAGFFSTNFVIVLGNSVAALTQTILMLFFLFFLYRDDRNCMRFVYKLLPLVESDAQRLVARIDETIRATFLGNFVVAAIQGLVAGVVFAALGVRDAPVLGVLVAVAAIIPYFGAYVVWFPVAVYLAMTGHWIKMAILFTMGTLVISTLDNFLYPIFVGAQLRQHPISVLLSLLGGIWLFGVSGLVLGPVIFSIAEVLLTIWNHDVDGTALALPEHH